MRQISTSAAVVLLLRSLSCSVAVSDSTCCESWPACMRSSVISRCWSASVARSDVTNSYKRIGVTTTTTDITTTYISLCEQRAKIEILLLRLPQPHTTRIEVCTARHGQCPQVVCQRPSSSTLGLEAGVCVRERGDARMSKSELRRKGQR